MSYLPLARKYRPQTFADLVGQEDTAAAIANGIKLGREAQAIIFSGVRGIGKTTTARLYAKALNCDQGPSPEPCNECRSCLAITAGSHEDVMEIDGASHTGVEDIRNLKETVSYAAQRSSYKIYIIDEVHMLSQSAFNALLKTLEEPPKKVIFLFATTELQKVPQTILSRCQVFYLNKFKVSDIQARLQYILRKENIEFEDKALHLISKEAHGSMRDALTLLDQAVAFGSGVVNLDSVQKFVSAASSGTVINFIERLLSKDVSGLLAAVQELDNRGIKYTSFLDDTITWLRHMFIAKEIGSSSLDMQMLALDEGEVENLLRIARSAELLELNRLFRVFVKARNDFSGSDMDRFILENVCLEWCLDPGLPHIEDLLQNLGDPSVESSRGGSRPTKISTASVHNESAPAREESAPPRRSLNLNEALREKPPVEPAKTSPAPGPISTPKPLTSSLMGATADPSPLRRATPPMPKSWKEVVELWIKVKPLQARIFEDTYEVSFSANEIVVAVDATSLAGAKLLQPAMQSKIEQQFSELFSFSGRFRAVTKDALQEVSTQDGQMTPETLREQKIRAKDEAKQQRREEVLADPITQFYIKAFDSEIEGVELS